MDTQIETIISVDNKLNVVRGWFLEEFIENVLHGKLKRATLLVVAIMQEAGRPIQFNTTYDTVNDYFIEDDYCGGDVREAIEILFSEGFIRYNKKTGCLSLIKLKIKREMLNGEVLIQEQ